MSSEQTGGPPPPQNPPQPTIETRMALRREIDAIHRIIDLLAELETASRQRVVDYLAAE